MQHIIADIECDGFLKTASMIHCLCIKELNTDTEYTFADQLGYLPLGLGLDILQQAETLIGHNFLRFDAPVIEKLTGIRLLPSQIIDTLVVAKAVLNRDVLRRSDAAQGLDKALIGRLSLEAFGQRLGRSKGLFGKTADWRSFSAQMAIYCANDVRLTEEVYYHLSNILDERTK